MGSFVFFANVFFSAFCLYPGSNVGVRAFSIQMFSTRSTFIQSRRASAVVVRSFFVDATVTEEDNEDGSAPVHDAQGKQFVEGTLVRVCAEGLKAFQIAPKGRGSFDDNKKFVPDDCKDTPMGLKYLLLPVGLRGTVTKVYENQLEVSANFPVQVKFSPGEYTDEGYDAPQAFLMHFAANELEVVDP